MFKILAAIILLYFSTITTEFAQIAIFLAISLIGSGVDTIIYSKK